MSLLTKLFGDPNKKVIDSIRPLITKINELEERYAAMTNEQLSGVTAGFRARLADGHTTLDDLLPEAFAAVREASRRTLNQRHFDVQLIGGVVMHRGQLAEMRTGEGKTLTATAPTYLNALAGKGAHVVTVNDYLSGRDAVWMGQVYYALGMSTACIQHESAFIYDPASIREGDTADTERDETGSFRIEREFLRPCTRKEAYEADITYGTNNEFGFDYLRDNLESTIDRMVQRGHFYAIVDEVDSILIDEARTPLIISAPAEESGEMYYQFARLVSRLVDGEDYNVDEKMKAATLTEEGLHKMEEWLGLGNVYTTNHIKVVHHIEQALKAHAIFKRDKDYVVRGDEVVIVDEFTGRMMEGRRYSEGLHQAIEAKEGVKIQRESRTYASVTFQNYFRLYEKLSGMTGTAMTEAEEFFKIYKLEVTAIPTNRSMVRIDLGDKVYKNRQGKYAAVVEEVKHRHNLGQPVLVGTISIEQNEVLSTMLEREGVPHQMLNAKNHEREAEIIAQAGRKRAVTIATNMAGRGVDIILGGNPVDEDDSKAVRELGGLHVIGTERHESRRIDNQLRGRAGRQGDPGSSQFYVSMEDDLMRVFGSDRIAGLMERLSIPEDMPIENKLVNRSIEEAQKKIETHHFDIRKHLVEYDDVINKHRETIYKKRYEILKAYDVEADTMEKKELAPKDRTLRKIVLGMVEQEITSVVSFHTQGEDPKEWNLKEVLDVVNTIFPVTPELAGTVTSMASEGVVEGSDKLGKVKGRTEFIALLVEHSVMAYDQFEQHVTGQMASLNQMIDPWMAIHQIERDMLIRAVDMVWVGHLEAIDHLRTGIGLRGYGQRDPLVEYKREAYRLFMMTLNEINKQVVYSIYKIGLTAAQATSQTQTEETLPKNAVYLAPSKSEEGEVEASTATGPTHHVGRNDPCPCGSGKKFKKCHGA